MTRTKNKSCNGKRRYLTWKEARAAAASGRGRFVRLSAYRCKFCGSLHIGHTPRRRHNG